MDEDYTDFETADQAYAREDAQFMVTGPLPDDEPAHDEDVAGAIAEVRRAA